jgi:exodeoxyribonuclease VII small subunit
MEPENFKDLSFEDALNRLETLVQELESGRIKLDDAIAAYEKAMALKKFCEEKLKSAQLKIEKFEITSDNQVVADKFEVPEA